MNSILERAREISPWIIGLRRDFHQHPELAFQEFRTTDRIVEELTNLGIPFKRLDPTGVVAEIRGDVPGKTVVLRGDIDALPIHEETDLPFKSCSDGVMHACGHDGNASMLLGAARILQERRAELKGTVRLVFQPAEETGGGAKKVIEQGVLDGAACAFGMHVIAGAPVGEVRTVAGPMFASSVGIEIEVTGKKCHGAFPQYGADAVLAGCAIVQNLQSMVSREFDTCTPLVVTIGSFVSDGAHNVLSGTAVLKGTIRTFDREKRAEIREAFYRIVESSAAAFRCTAKIQYNESTGVVYNVPELVESSCRALEEMLPKDRIVLGETFMGSEDFAEFSARVPSVYFTAGAKGGFPSHHGKFEIDEEGLHTGAAVYAQAAINALENWRGTAG